LISIIIENPTSHMYKVVKRRACTQVYSHVK